MKKILLCGLFIVFSFIGMAQKITLINPNSGETIPGVTLTSENPKASAVTNAVGEVDISVFKTANKIIIRSLGFETKSMSYYEMNTSAKKVTLTPSNFNLDEVVVSATRWRQAANDIPSKIISISAKEVALQNPQTAADLLGISGKVFIQKSQQGGGSPMIRGFATNRLIYTLDGVRMNTAIFRSGNIQNVINIDPFATQNTEVFFGPGSVIYGSDAIGGVMSFQTLTSQLSLTDKPLITGNAVSRYATANNERTGHFDVNIGLKKWAFVTSFSAWDYDHLRQGVNGPNEYLKPIYVKRIDSIDRIITQDDPLLQVPSAYSQINLMQKVRFKLSDKWDFQYGFHYSETSPYGRYDRHNRYRNSTLRYAEWNYGPQLWLMNNLSVTHNGMNGLYDELTLRLAHQRFEESRIDRSLNKDDRSTQKEAVNALSANIDFAKSISEKNTIYYGVEWVTNEVSSQGRITDISKGITVNGPSRYPKSTWSSYAAYLNDEWRLNKKFTIQSGVRYNQFELSSNFSNNLPYYPFPFTSANINNGALAGSIGGIYRPTEKWVIKVNAGTAFRSPNIDDVGKVFDSEPGAVTIPNPNLKAEYAYNFDVGFAKVFGNSIKLDLTGYYTLLENALVRRNFQLNGQDSIFYSGIMSQVQAIQNAAVANVYGVQFGFEAKLNGGFSFTTDLNYQKGEEELDDGSLSASSHAAPFFGVSRMKYQTEKFSLELNCQYQGEQSFNNLAVSEQSKDEIYAKDKNGNNYAPGWYTLNVRAMYRLTDWLTLTSGIENITDQRYRPYSSGISGAGRNFVMALKARF